MKFYFSKRNMIKMKYELYLIHFENLDKYMKV